MSHFDHYAAVNDGAVLGFYGDPAAFVAGPLGTSRPQSTTDTAVLDVIDVRDDSGVVVESITVIEYPKSAWPYPRRGDSITMNPDADPPGNAWQVSTLRNDTGRSLIVEVNRA